MDKVKLVELLQNANLGDQAEAILQYVRPCIRLHASPLDNPNELPLGASRIGGLPDLPHGVQWLTRNGRFCEFIAQINLSDVSKYDETGLLPKEGQLLFFYDGLEYEDTSHQPYQKGAETIIYYTGGVEALERATDYPDLLEEWQRYEPCSITFELDWMLPNWPAIASAVLEQEVLHDTALEQDESESPLVKAYRQMTDDLVPEEDADKHHLLGYPEPVIQDDPLYAAPGVWEWENKHLDKGALAEWMLLLQISSDDGPGMLWGDISSVYYCIRKDDLIAGQFHDAICIEQNS